MIAFFQTGFLSMVPHLCRALVAPLVGLVGHVMFHTPYQMPIYFNIHTHQHHHNNHYQVYDFLSKAGVRHLTLQVHLSQHQLFWFVTFNLSSWIISFSSCIQHCRLNNACFRKSSPPSTVLEWSLDWSPFHSLQPGSSGSSTFNTMQYTGQWNNTKKAWWKFT